MLQENGSQDEKNVLSKFAGDFVHFGEKRLTKTDEKTRFGGGTGRGATVNKYDCVP